MFSDFPEQAQAVQLLQRSIERGRLAHAYLLTGETLDDPEAIARTLAKALNCSSPPRRSPGGLPLDSCDACDNCQRIQHSAHPDILWVRPESKSRVIVLEQMRQTMQAVNLKPSSASYKVAVISAADRLTTEAANAFLKTLEEPPPKSILILLTTEPQRLLDTILSRCLRINLAAGAAPVRGEPAAWLAAFAGDAARSERGLMPRYRLLGLLLQQLAGQKEAIEKALTARSPLERYDDIDPKTREKLQDELTASIEAEYRRQRADIVGLLQWWLRDIWLHTLASGAEMISFPELDASARAVGARITTADALRNLERVDLLRRQLDSNVQEALAFEVGLLQLKL